MGAARPAEEMSLQQQKIVEVCKEAYKTRRAEIVLEGKEAEISRTGICWPEREEPPTVFISIRRIHEGSIEDLYFAIFDKGRIVRFQDYRLAERFYFPK